MKVCKVEADALLSWFLSPPCLSMHLLALLAILAFHLKSKCDIAFRTRCCPNVIHPRFSLSPVPSFVLCKNGGTESVSSSNDSMNVTQFSSGSPPSLNRSHPNRRRQGSATCSHICRDENVKVLKWRSISGSRRRLSIFNLRAGEGESDKEGRISTSDDQQSSSISSR